MIWEGRFLGGMRKWPQGWLFQCQTNGSLQLEWVVAESKKKKKSKMRWFGQHVIRLWKSLRVIVVSKFRCVQKGKYLRKHFFTEGVVKHRNRLLRDVVDAQGLSAFRSDLYNALNNTL